MTAEAYQKLAGPPQHGPAKINAIQWIPAFGPLRLRYGDVCCQALPHRIPADDFDHMSGSTNLTGRLKLNPVPPPLCLQMDNRMRPAPGEGRNSGCGGRFETRFGETAADNRTLAQTFAGEL